MKKFLAVICLLCTLPICAEEYTGEYEVYANYWKNDREPIATEEQLLEIKNAKGVNGFLKKALVKFALWTDKTNLDDEILFAYSYEQMQKMEKDKQKLEEQRKQQEEINRQIERDKNWEKSIQRFIANNKLKPSRSYTTLEKTQQWQQDYCLNNVLECVETAYMIASGPDGWWGKEFAKRGYVDVVGNEKLYNEIFYFYTVKYRERWKNGYYIEANPILWQYGRPN